MAPVLKGMCANSYFTVYLKRQKASSLCSKSFPTWVFRQHFLQHVTFLTCEELLLRYEVFLQSSLWASASSEHVSTVCTGSIRPSIQRVPKTSLRLALQGLQFSASCPLCIWHHVCPRATSSTCWQQKPAHTKPMPSHTYSISTRNNCRPEIVPVRRYWGGEITVAYIIVRMVDGCSKEKSIKWGQCIYK